MLRRKAAEWHCTFAPEIQWKFVQEGNLKKILGYACEHTAYYKSLYSLNQVENPRKMLASLPLLDKAKILNLGGQIYSALIPQHFDLTLFIST